jgi:hypothetical protein
MESQIRFVSGLDLGQAQDFTALAVLEQTTLPDLEKPNQKVHHYAVRHLERFPLGTSYTAVCARLVTIFTAPPLTRTQLAVDQTGVGRPVIDMLKKSSISASIRPITITGGTRRRPARRAGGWSRRKNSSACCRSCFKPGGSRWRRRFPRRRRWCGN